MLAHVISVDAQRPNHVTVFALTNDIEKAKAFMGSPELKETMKAAGVKGKPEMVFLENVELAMAPPTAEQTSLPDVVQAIEVKDFDAWKTAFEAQSDARKAAGIAGYCIHRDVDAPSKVYVMYQAESHDVLKKYLNSPETKKAQKAAGVKGPSKVWYENDKEFVSYGN
ncbi:MAG: antibiotic biosynthesis monooxygenase [Polyangiales bacterium]